MCKKKIKRRANMLYRLRKKGIRCDTKQKTIYLPYGQIIPNIIELNRLREEFYFLIQLNMDNYV